MRPSSLIYILVGVLIFASYQILDQPRVPNLPPDQSDDPPSTYKDESRSQDGDVVPANLNTDESTAKDEPQLDGNLLATNQFSDPRAAKKNLSYLADYAYSEVPPETKPADTVLKSLEDIPRGTPVEEIKRVADAFGMDFNFMKAVAKIE
jgi:hypothetical protein